jgi:hypothetical protein
MCLTKQRGDLLPNDLGKTAKTLVFNLTPTNIGMPRQ